MHRRTLLATAAATALAACTSAPVADESAPPVDVEAPPGDFDIALYRELAAAGGNQFVSPYSVSSAFALLYPGARGETQSEIASVLGFDASAQVQSQRTRALAEALRLHTGGSEFAVANAAWVE